MTKRFEKVYHYFSSSSRLAVRLLETVFTLENSFCFELLTVQAGLSWLSSSKKNQLFLFLTGLRIKIAAEVHIKENVCVLVIIMMLTHTLHLKVI